MADAAYVTKRDEIMRDYRVTVRYVPDHPDAVTRDWVTKDGRLVSDPKVTAGQKTWRTAHNVYGGTHTGTGSNPETTVGGTHALTSSDTDTYFPNI